MLYVPGRQTKLCELQGSVGIPGQGNSSTLGWSQEPHGQCPALPVLPTTKCFVSKGSAGKALNPPLP